MKTMLTKILIGTKSYKSALLDLALLLIKHYKQLTEDFYTTLKSQPWTYGSMPFLKSQFKNNITLPIFTLIKPHNQILKQS
ncbi:hypothetical protein [Winogradskyella rapida]|uniref:Uncharacterized protein n=1 Tax=Winogradskyella rapida TaxID=549701 RepID=A0ABW3KR65_9FLAO